MPHHDWIAWQLADASFPSGGFAHSAGLEAAWRHGELGNEAGLERFLRDALHQTGASTLPFVEAARSGSQAFEAIDRAYDATVLNDIANRASRAQGQALLSAITKIYKEPAIKELKTICKQAGCPTHAAPLFGALAGRLDLPADTTHRLFMFQSLRMLISAGVRLGVIGPLRGQAVQHRLAGAAEDAAVRFGTTPIEQTTQTMPIADLLQAGHDRLYSRLFQS